MKDSSKSIPGPTPDSPRIAIARLSTVTDKGAKPSKGLDVHFNPASLQLQVSNEIKDTKNKQRSQYIAKSTAKLTMELQFDTTDSGEDVTATTRRIQAFIAPPMPKKAANNKAPQQPPPPVVVFEWGRVKFQGIAESYKETIDFFSANGVPLRSTVNLTLTRQDQVFDSAPDGAAANAGPLNDAMGIEGLSASEVANTGESPDAARSLAAANGLESLRFGVGAELTVSAGISLQGPADFAAGASSGLSLGTGGGLDLGAAIGLGGDAGGEASAGFSAGVSNLARLSATEGAFSGLRTVAPSTGGTARLNTDRLQPSARSTTLATDRHATFQVGGKATLEGSSGLRADVGANGSPARRLRFEGA